MDNIDCPTYPKISSIYKRNTETAKLIPGDYVDDVLPYLQDHMWVFTEKLDGTNIRVDYKSDTNKFTIQGRTDNAMLHPTLLEHLNSIFNEGSCKDFLNTLKVGRDSTNFTLYGEGIGPKIQAGGGLYCSAPKFVLFDVLFGGRTWAKRETVAYYGSGFGVPVVPVVGVGSLDTAIRAVSMGMNSTLAESPKQSEGIVIRPAIELKNSHGQRIIYKLKTKDFV